MLISEPQSKMFHHPRYDSGVGLDEHNHINKARLTRCIAKSQEWLERNKGTLVAETENGISFKDNFVSLLILELSSRWDYVDLRIPARRWNYFGGKPVIVPADYPDDNDTNAVAFSVLKPTPARAKDIMDEMLQCENKDGIIQVHLDPNRPRMAPEVSANILTLFYLFERGHEVQPSLHYLQTAMERTEYEQSRYYFMPEPLFFFVWRLVRVAAPSSCPTGGLADAPIPSEMLKLRERLITRLQARMGTDLENALCPAMRLLLSQDLGLKNDVDFKALLDLQEDDGSFGAAYYVRYGSCGIKISHRGFACVIALEALKTCTQSHDSS